jgi:formate hydrogenlyase subunit 3/multisubunit Na+/H+ antiporter MnhD subunit
VNAAAILLFAAPATPLAMLVLCLAESVRRRMPNWLALAPLPALAAAAAGSAPLVRLPPPLRLTLMLDRPGATLLGVAALLWVGAGAAAAIELRGDPHAGRFAEYWLLTLTGSIGVFMTADLVSFYLAYSIVSLAAWGLIVHRGTPQSARAGAVYLALAVLGEAFLLLAFVFMAEATKNDSLLIGDVVAALPGSPWRAASLTLLVLGFGLKIGLVPGHGWMPLAYRAAPIPAAAALSGAAVKAGIIGLLRFLPLGLAMPGWGTALAAIGMVSAFYGVAVGLTQSHPKTVLAYSSVSQMGLLAATLGSGWVTGEPGIAAGVSFAAANHTLVKGALFLACGAAASGSRRWLVLLPAAILALGLGGLPLTGGALAKLALKPAFGSGLSGALATASAVASSVLMLHFLRRLRAAKTVRSGPGGPGAIWLATAFAAIAAPWAIYPAAGISPRFEAVMPDKLMAALLPVLTGLVLFAGLLRWGARLPALPAGDIVVAGEAAIRTAVRHSAAIERADRWLRQWPVASLLALGVAILLGALGLARH